MKLQRLSLVNFRNYKEAHIQFFEGVHVIYGENGSGKTSILEAIHYLALTKSFRTTNDKNLILNTEKMFRIQGEFSSGQGTAIQSAIGYSPANGKSLTVNGQKAQKFSDYIGEIPLVLLHPADLTLSQGGPAQRRRFLDILLSQSSALYLHSLIQYNRSLRQRNQLLSEAREGKCDPQLLKSWEENLIAHGTELIRKRQEATARLSESVKQHYRGLSNSEDKVKIIYRCNVETQSNQSLAEAYHRLFEQSRAKEVEYGTTLPGPHRDDLLFLLSGKPLKDYASQGEHKTFIIALKLAEFQHLQQQRLQAPILLFDDIFGELDANRIQQMLQQLGHIGQVFITTTSRNFFDKMGPASISDLPIHYYRVEDGGVAATEA
ncbi:MAG: DNA replication/repair protein RecF [Calditrichaceae bacterium]|nr:DNA replication/repair protein RecF [Calditrichia bacterium]NUQ40012.1 DNA replication/repair protein RecF [Calditrichaceae bacterium]